MSRYLLSILFPLAYTQWSLVLPSIYTRRCPSGMAFGRISGVRVRGCNSSPTPLGNWKLSLIGFTDVVFIETYRKPHICGPFVRRHVTVCRLPWQAIVPFRQFMTDTRKNSQKYHKLLKMLDHSASTQNWLQNYSCFYWSLNDNNKNNTQFLWASWCFFKVARPWKVKVMAWICLEPIISKTAGDTLSIMTSRDSKGQGHPDIFGWKYFEEC